MSDKKRAGGRDSWAGPSPQRMWPEPICSGALLQSGSLSEALEFYEKAITIFERQVKAGRREIKPLLEKGYELRQSIISGLQNKRR